MHLQCLSHALTAELCRTPVLLNSVGSEPSRQTIEAFCHLTVVLLKCTSLNTTIVKLHACQSCLCGNIKGYERWLK